MSACPKCGLKIKEGETVVWHGGQMFHPFCAPTTPTVTSDDK